MGTNCFYIVFINTNLSFPVLTIIGGNCFNDFRSTSYTISFGALIISSSNSNFLSLPLNSISNYSLTLLFEALQTITTRPASMLDNRVATTSTGATNTILQIKTGSAGSPNASTKS